MKSEVGLMRRLIAAGILCCALGGELAAGEADDLAAQAGATAPR